MDFDVIKIYFTRRRIKNIIMILPLTRNMSNDIIKKKNKDNHQVFCLVTILKVVRCLK